MQSALCVSKLQPRTRCCTDDYYASRTNRTDRDQRFAGLWNSTSTVGMFARRQHAERGLAKPGFWMVTQAYELAEDQMRDPTPEELRYAVHVSVLAGGRGLFLYNSYRTNTSWAASVVPPVLSELHALAADVLAADKAADGGIVTPGSGVQLNGSSELLSGAVYSGAGGRSVLLAARHALSGRALVEIKVSTSYRTAVRTRLGVVESRHAIEGGRFADWLGPLDIALYVLSN